MVIVGVASLVVIDFGDSVSEGLVNICLSVGNSIESDLTIGGILLGLKNLALFVFKFEAKLLSCESLAAEAFLDCPDVTIFSYSGSYAEAYAGKHHISFVPLK